MIPVKTPLHTGSASFRMILTAHSVTAITIESSPPDKSVIYSNYNDTDSDTVRTLQTNVSAHMYTGKIAHLTCPSGPAVVPREELRRFIEPHDSTAAPRAVRREIFTPADLVLLYRKEMNIEKLLYV